LQSKAWLKVSTKKMHTAATVRKQHYCKLSTALLIAPTSGH